MRRGWLVGLLALGLLLSGCAGPLPEEEGANLQAAELCAAVWQSAPREPSPYSEQEVWLTLAGQREIEDCLRAAGLAVAQRDQEGVSLLCTGQEALQSFAEQVQSGQEAEVTIYSVERRGQLIARTYRLEDGEKLRTEAVLSWDKRGRPQLEEVYTLPVTAWTLTEKGNFICSYGQKLSSHEVLRLHAPDEQYALYAARYLLPMGYQGHNLFSSDWSEENWQALAINDLFADLYKLQTGRDLDVERFAYDGQKGWRTVPAEVFEQVIYQNFAISPAALRQAAHYDEEARSYPWVELNCLTWDAQPLGQPDVIGAVENADGTLTLTVEVLCAQAGTDQIFTHELTVRPLSDGGFQYVRNRLLSGERADYVSRLTYAQNDVSNIF